MVPGGYTVREVIEIALPCLFAFAAANADTVNEVMTHGRDDLALSDQSAAIGAVCIAAIAVFGTGGFHSVLDFRVQVVAVILCTGEGGVVLYIDLRILAVVQEQSVIGAGIVVAADGNRVVKDSEAAVPVIISEQHLGLCHVVDQGTKAEVGIGRNRPQCSGIGSLDRGNDITAEGKVLAGIAVDDDIRTG